MKKTAFILTLALLLLASFVNLAMANPGVPSDIPPIVSIDELRVNAVISRENGVLWAKVDAAYNTSTIHAFGDNYVLPKEFPSPTDPSPFITYTVVTDKLEAHYPIPLNAANVTVKINNEERQWQFHSGRLHHLFDLDMPEINWTIEPVPRTFTATVHYEYPVTETSEAYADLGQYVLLLSLVPRYGSTESPFYPLYSWFGHGSTRATFSIQTDPAIKQINAYYVNSTGSLTTINYSNSSALGASAGIEFEISNDNEQSSFPYGAVVVMDAEPAQEPLPLTLVVVILAVPIAITLVLLYSHRKRAVTGFMSNNPKAA